MLLIFLGIVWTYHRSPLVHDTWVQSDQWSSSDWCVYNRFTRTNNDVDGWHHRLNNRDQKKNLPFYSLIKLLLEKRKLIIIREWYVATGRYRRRRYVWIKNFVRRLWNEFIGGRLTPLQLLRQCANLFGRNRRRFQ